MEAWTFVILALASHRIQRIFTADHWPPTEALRDYIDNRFGPNSSYATFISCGWCFGFWVTIAVFAEHRYLSIVPMLVYTIFAASSIVGLVATYDD